MSSTLSIGSKTLFEHQMVGVEWMRMREQDDSFCGGFLCDEMGLGKTLTTLAHIHSSPAAVNNLLFGPLAVLNQWQDAAADAGLRVFRLVKGAWVCVEGGNSSTTACLYMSNYDRLLASPKAFLRDIAWDRFILDEAHTMRNGGSKRYAILRKIKSPRTWFLTGTPLVNNTKDLSALVHLINRSHKPTKPMTESEGSVLMAKYGLARTMAMVRDKIRGAPGQFSAETHRLPFATNAERLFYRGVQGALKKQLQMLYEGRLKGNTELMFLVMLLRMRQISVHLQVYVDSLKQRAAAARRDCPVKDYQGSSTKIEKLVGLLADAAAAPEGKRDWVVFCQFREEINLIEDRLKKEGALVSRIFRYDGSMTMEARQEQINASKQDAPEDAGKQKVFLVQIKAGGAGLNLQHFHNVVFMSPWWNAAQMDQAIGRVQRIGQAKKVQVHYLVLEEEEEQSRNIDRYMYKKVVQKKEICESFLRSASHFLEREDMEAQADIAEEDVAGDNVEFYEQFEQVEMNYDMFEDDEEIGSVVTDSDGEGEDPQ